MNDKQIARRRFLVAAMTFSGVAASSGASILATATAWADETHGPEPAAMGRLAKLLFPHEGLSDSVYGRVIGQVLDAAAADPGLAGRLGAVEAALNGARGRPWIELDAEAQVEIMRELQAEPLFSGIVETVRFNFYEHPDVWAHIGYPGSSKEFGGYKYRGFDDIDWLPEDA